MFRGTFCRGQAASGHPTQTNVNFRPEKNILPFLSIIAFGGQRLETEQAAGGGQADTEHTCYSK